MAVGAGGRRVDVRHGPALVEDGMAGGTAEFVDGHSVGPPSAAYVFWSFSDGDESGTALGTSALCTSEWIDVALLRNPKISRPDYSKLKMSRQDCYIARHRVGHRRYT
jgi:hypothetical protein